MKKFPRAVAGVLILGGLLLAAPLVHAKKPKILEFDTMVGVPTGMTGTKSPIRGINGGGLAWAIGDASGELRADGHLEIAVVGLVFAEGPNTGANTVANFRAVVSCLTGDGAAVNVSTGLFPATTGPATAGGGNAAIEAHLALPHPCIAPIVFVTSPAGSWFAATGR